MAPSPELLQPKAPDKVVPDTTNTTAANTTTYNTIVSVANSSSSSNKVILVAAMTHTAALATTTTPSRLVSSPSTSSSSSPPPVGATEATVKTTTNTSDENNGIATANVPTAAATAACILAAVTPASSSQNSCTKFMHSNAAASNATTSTGVASETQNLGNLDDVELKNLLDEAITYKRPKDREHKSEIFKELLHHAEMEDQARVDCYRNCVSSLSKMGSGRHKQGGSLQDLVEAVLDTDHSVRGGRHHHNSRQKKYSSVSSRQREGGSLPSNVNCKECSFDESFMSEFNKRKNKLEKVHGSRTVVASEDADEAEPPRHSDNVPVSSDLSPNNHTIIEIEPDETQHLLAADSLAQGITEPLGNEPRLCGTTIEMNLYQKQSRIVQPYMQFDTMIGESTRISMGATAATAAALAAAASSSSYSIDKTVNFSPLLKSHGNPPVKAMHLNNYMAVNSCVTTDSSGLKMSGISGGSALTTTTSATLAPNVSSSQSPLTSITLTTANGARATVVTDPKYTQNIQIIPEPKHTDENGNALFGSALGQSSSGACSLGGGGGPVKSQKGKKVHKGDRNTTTLIAKEIPGNRGDDDILKLLSFIENNDRSRKNNSNNHNNNNNNNAGGGGGVSEKIKRSSIGNKKDSPATPAPAPAPAQAPVSSKLKKSNSLEELTSMTNALSAETSRLLAAVRNQTGKETYATGSGCAANTNSDVTVTLRAKLSDRQKKNVNANAVAAATASVGVETPNPSGFTAGQKQHKRNERRSWGTEELTYLGDSSTTASGPLQAAKANINNNNSDDVTRKNPKDTTNSKPESTTMAAVPPTKFTKFEANRNSKTTAADVLIRSSTNDLVTAGSETAEFHVVTKKKKAKKRSTGDELRPQKATTLGTNVNNNNNTTTNINNSNDRRFGYHSETRPLTGKYAQSIGYQQATAGNYDRDSYLNFNHHGAYNHQQQQQQPQYQYQQQQQHHYSYTSVATARDAQTTPGGHRMRDQQQQHQQQQPQTLQPTTKTPTHNNSRRKSTSSVPPSEKSDSSDLDSVHSLPIESTMRYNDATTTTTNTTDDSRPNNSSKAASTKQQLAGNNSRSTGNSSQSSSSAASSPPSQISYADIARISNAEKQQVAANAASSSANNTNNSTTVTTTASSSNNTPTSADVAVVVDDVAAQRLQQSIRKVALDMWPSVSKASSPESQHQQNTPDNAGALPLASNNTNTSSGASSSGSSCASSTSSSLKHHQRAMAGGDTPTTSTGAEHMLPKPVTFSQMLIHQEIPQPTAPATATASPPLASPDSDGSSCKPAATTADATTKPKGGAQQKVKSIDRDDPYPALSKTVKPAKNSVMQTSAADTTPLADNGVSVAPRTKPASPETVEPTAALGNRKSTKFSATKTTMSQPSQAAFTVDAQPPGKLHITGVPCSTVTSIIATTTTSSTSTKKANKKDKAITARPAVIILDDNGRSTGEFSKLNAVQSGVCTATGTYVTSASTSVIDNNTMGAATNAQPHSSPLRFGDFNDDVLRLLEQDCDIQYVVDGPSMSMTLPPLPPGPAIVECCSCAGQAMPVQRHQSAVLNLNLTPDDNSAESVEFLDTSGTSEADATTQVVVHAPLVEVRPAPVAMLATSKPAAANAKAAKQSARTEPRVERNKAAAQSIASGPPHTASRAALLKYPPSANLPTPITQHQLQQHQQQQQSVAMTGLKQPSVSFRGSQTGTSENVMAALTAIAQQNKSAVNTVDNAKGLAELTVRYIAPPPASLQNLANYNHDKIVNFVGLAWQDILIGGAKYYSDSP